MDRTLIANATIFEGSGAAPFTGDVLVEGQRVNAVQRGGGLPRAGARIIDGAGATLMPGLVEPHGHVSYPDAATNADFTRLPPEEHVLVTMRNARTMLECGYTSVLSGASAKPRLDIVIRNEIEAGRICPTSRHRPSPGSPTAPTRSARCAVSSCGKAPIFSSSIFQATRAPVTAAPSGP